MATHYAARWRPQIYRSTLETILQGDAGTEQRVETLQLVVFDDTEVATAGNPYQVGEAATETKLAIVDEKVIQLAVSAFSGLTEAQAKALWDDAKAAQISAWQADPIIMTKVRAARGAYLSTHTVIA